ncbi:aldehyde dehydrogenase, putative [Trypanosoma cruzi]|uniref:Aldehyde dehydrogenase, putative n=1 Tax=Trypanosoma cruzi (strain CL Brener) TaxID=353153 RepID=Q4DFG3_TRYCC|nr:aldehyde dehydrogenase, putative [Trypanosoma cruzi]EAN91264.1 aldehyde dehydrogenase, putative [Trypanosoma cruzi]|eukprot:XP_813115.1 aldehyde dehydrogenase [Trypanosoma cruzi strain CL Brener]
MKGKKETADMWIEQVNPAIGKKLEPVERNTVGDVKLAVRHARDAQKVWVALSFAERAKRVEKVKRFLADNAERGASIISQCNGKTRCDALATEILPSVMACEWYAANTARVLAPQKLSRGNMLFFNKSNTLQYIPLGVVGIISPWNFPFTIPFSEVIMALMAGNGVVLKVATATTHVGRFIEECISAGDFPPGLFVHVVMQGSDVGPAMLKAGVDKLFFTGSVHIGKQLMAAAAETLTPVSLELGGNDPMIVLADASIERAVNCALWAGFQNAGQACASVERIYVHESIHDEFLSELAAKTRALRHGPDINFNVDIGAVTTEVQLRTIKEHVEDAISRGARIVAQSTPTGDVSSGNFYPATVLTGVTADMLVMREETFGPVLPVVPFSTEEEAIAMANDCRFALTSSVFSRNRANAWRVAEKLESGVVSINDHLYEHGMSEVPWGGWKNSGIGRTHGELGLKEMCHVRCINDDCLPSGFIHRDLWWFPQSHELYDTLLHAVSVAAPRGVTHAMVNFFSLMKRAGMIFRPWRPQIATCESALRSAAKKETKSKTL